MAKLLYCLQKQFNVGAYGRYGKIVSFLSQLIEIFIRQDAPDPDTHAKPHDYQSVFMLNIKLIPQKYLPHVFRLPILLLAPRKIKRLARGAGSRRNRRDIRYITLREQIAIRKSTQIRCLIRQRQVFEIFNGTDILEINFMLFKKLPIRGRSLIRIPEEPERHCVSPLLPKNSRFSG